MSSYSEETLAALLASAQRWETEHPDELRNYLNCALCKLHRTVIPNRYVVCHGCPIRNKTGKHGCESSPYDAFFFASNKDDAIDKAREFSRWLYDLYEEVK